MKRSNISNAFLTGLACAVASALVGCNADQAMLPRLQSVDVALGSVQASPVNVIMAVGDSLQVKVLGQTLSGAAIASFDSVLYVLASKTDTLRVRVSPTGMVKALASSEYNPVTLDVYGFRNGSVKADEMIIQITSTAIAGATLSIQPVPPDSARLSQNTTKSIDPVIGNASTGEYVPNPQLRFTFHANEAKKMSCYAPSFSDLGDFTGAELSVTNCGPGAYSDRIGLNQIRALDRKGTAWVIASANVYGVDLSDSVQYTLTNQFFFSIEMGAKSLDVYGGESTYGIIYLAAGGTIQFGTYFPPEIGGTVSFTFDNPSAVTATNPPADVGGTTGNTTGLGPHQSTTRQFNTAGTYIYTGTWNGAIAPFGGQIVTGTIVVE